MNLLIIFLRLFWYKKSPEQYVFNESNKKRARACMGFSSQSGKFTMGSTWMIGHEIIFDIKNRKIGIAEAYCDKSHKNKSMDDLGIESVYPKKSFEKVGRNKILDFFLNERMVGIYIFLTIILFLVLVYLISVLINFNKSKRNPWLWFLKNNTSIQESFIPIRYDVNDTNQNNTKNKEINLVSLSTDDKNVDLTHSKYSKINV